MGLEVTAVCARAGGDQAFVAGIQDDGDVVIERWVFPVRNGRWHHVPPAMQAIGTPMGPYAGTTEIKGGTYAPLPPTHVAPERRVILESAAFALIRGMEVDPEERFLLFQDHDDGTLYRIQMDEGAVEAPEALYTIAQIPELGQTIWMGKADYKADGKRVWILSEPSSETKVLGQTARVVLWDDDNDGNFDSFQVMTYRDYYPMFDSGLFLGPSYDPKTESPWKR